MTIARRLPQFAADGGRIAQVLNGFKQRNRHQAGVALSSLHVDTAQAREPNHIQHIFGARSAADHVVANGFGGGGCFQLRDRTKGIDHVGGGCAQRRRHRRPAYGVRLPGRGFFQRRGMQPRMLADIERLQMEAVRPHFQDQRINQRLRRPGTTVFDEAGMQNLKVREKFLRRLVPRQACQRGIQRWSLGTTHAGKTHPNAAEKPAVRFKLIALAESLLTGGIQLVQIIFQSVFERTADRRLLRGTGEQIEDEYKLALIMFE